MDTFNQQYTHTILKYSSSIFMLLDHQEKILEMNINAQNALGVFVGDLITDIQTFDAFGKSDFINAVQAVYKTSGSQVVESSMLTKDGPLTFALTFLPILDNLGDVTQIFVEGKNVTQQNQYKQNLFVERTFKNAILNNTTDGIAVFDTNSKLIFSNDAAAEIFYLNYYLDSLKLQPMDIFDFYTIDGSRLLHKDELTYVKSLQGIKVKNFEQRVVLKDELPDTLSFLREEFTAKSLSVSSGIIRDKSEKVIGTVISYKDITEQKIYEQKLLQEQAFTNAILNNTAEGISVFDAEGKKTYINEIARELTGIDGLPDTTTLKMENPFDFYTPDGNREIPFEELPLSLALQGIEVKDFQELMQLKDDLPPELLVLKKTFESKFLSVNSRIIRNSVGETLSIVISYKDITQEKLLEEQTFIKTILENTSEGITNLNTNGEMIYANSQARKILSINKYQDIANYKLRNIFDIFDVHTGKLLSNKELPLDLALKGVEIDDFQGALRVKDDLPERFEGLKEYFGRKVISISSSNIVNNKKELTSVVLSYRDITKLKQDEEVLSKTRQRLAGSREEERRHLARELHDSIIQDLMGYSYEFATVEHLITTGQEELIDLQNFIGMRHKLTKSIKELRRFIGGLRPVGLEEFGFYSAISSYIALLERDAKDKENFPRITFNMDATTEIPVTLNLCLYRSAQEALTNIMKHAKADNILIQLKRSLSDKTLVLTIKDDGIGFDIPDDINDLPSNNFGLIGIAERVELVEGQFSITSQKGEGTIITVTLPYDFDPDS